MAFTTLQFLVFSIFLPNQKKDQKSKLTQTVFSSDTNSSLLI